MRLAYVIPALLLMALAASRVQAKVIDRIVAVVNGEVITLSELEVKARPLIRQYLKDVKDPVSFDEKKKEILSKVLPQLVDERLIQKEIDRLGIKVSKQEVEAAIEGICKENGLTLEELKEKLERDGYTLEGYKKEIKKQIERTAVINSQVKAKIVVTDAQVLAYLKEHPGSGIDLPESGPRYILQQICIVPGKDPASVARARERAKEALSALESGKEFSEVAKEYSDLPSAKDGGYLGALTPGEMAAFLRKAVLKLKPGEHSGVIETPMGFQIFRLKAIDTSARGVDKNKMEEVRRKLYRQQINARFEEWLQELRSKSTIRILL